MPQTLFRIAPHTLRSPHAVVEVWVDGQFVGQITPGDAADLRVISKYALLTSQTAGQGTALRPDLLTVTFDIAQTVRQVRE